MPVGLAGVDQLHRAAVVDCALSGRAAAGTGAGSEDDRVAAGDAGRDRVWVEVLEVRAHRHRAHRLEVGGVVEVSDQPEAAVAALGEQPEQAQGDLPVPAGNRYVHRHGLILTVPVANCREARTTHDLSDGMSS